MLTADRFSAPMARQEEDREDLLREATALGERVELEVAGEPAAVVAGFRRDGAASLFFGADPVYQFNAQGDLRRAYVGGLLFKADRGRLASLRRMREEDRLVLSRTDLDDAQQAAFLSTMLARLLSLRDALEQGRCRELGRVPADVDVTRRVAAWLRDFAGRGAIAQSPHAGGKGSDRRNL